MPLTPVVWLSEFIANLTTAGAQTTPRITQLANGQILVTWTSDDPGGVGSPAGDDVIGQFFDPLGTLIGTEFLVNDTFTGNAEGDADVAALSNGGFVAVYEDTTSGTDSSIRLTERDATGALVRSVTIALDTTSSNDPSFFNPRVATSGATSVLVVYQEFEVGGESRVVGRLYDPATGSVGTAISLINVVGQNRDPSVAVLGNGNYVIACETFDPSNGGDSRISYRIINATGGNVLGVNAIPETAGGTNISEKTPSVTALTGGGFVIAWSRDDLGDEDIMLRIFNDAGAAQGSLVTIASAGISEDNVTPAVVALSDGGFVVFWDDGVVGKIMAQHVAADGVLLGDAIIVADGGAASNPDAQLLGDGRIAVTFTRGDGEIGMAIIDTRDTVNDPAVYPDGLQIGTLGDDTFTADFDALTVVGHTGNDTITGTTRDESESDGQSFRLGDGDDMMIVVSFINFDNYDGGAGNDLIDWSALTDDGTIFNLTAGTASFNSISETMTGFEHLTGSAFNDTIIGTDGDNILSGGAGDDTVSGGAGSDTVSGGAGKDTILVTGDGFFDTSKGGRGNDTFVLNNSFFAGDLNGGGGKGDRIDASAYVNFALVADLAAGTYVDDGSTFDLINIEHATGGQLSDTITGSTAANILDGRDGADTLIGGAGNDILLGGNGRDKLSGGSEKDTFAFDSALAAGNVDQILDFSVLNDTIRLDNDIFFGLAFGKLEARALATNAAGQAETQADRIIYETDTGRLFFDSDGVGGAARIQVAKLAAGLVLTNADFIVA